MCVQQGSNDCILRDKSKVYHVDPGDLLFMKGKVFPGPGRGLVHKSPEVQYHSNGMAKQRLAPHFLRSKRNIDVKSIAFYSQRDDRNILHVSTEMTEVLKVDVPA